MKTIAHLIPQDQYAAHLADMAQYVEDFKKSIPPAELEKFRKFNNRAPRLLSNTEANDSRITDLRDSENRERFEKARDLVKMRKRILEKAGVTSALGYNFYDLRGPAYLIYPVLTPFRNSLARIGRVNDGYGTAAHWIATRNFGTQYGGVVEGQRNALATPDENPYTATYKELGIERGLTFTSQFAGEGYTDNIADEHLRGLHEIELQEESLMLLGNSGVASGNNGFGLGTMNTPVSSLVASSSGLGSGVNVSAFCVALTALGNPNNAQYGYGVFPTVAGGLTPSYVRSNYDGSTTTINCGTSQISAASNVSVTDSSHEKVNFLATAVKGAFAYAWYVNVTDSSAPAKANSYLHSITTFPTLTISAAPTGTQTAAATGLSSDHSFNVYDFDGLLTYAANAGTWTDMAGSSLTKGVGGSVTEIDNDLQTMWNNYQAQPDAIWCSTDAKIFVDNTIMAANNGASAFRFEYTRDSQGQLQGGFVVDAYKSKFGINPAGSKAIPLRTHPMIPSGTIYYDINENPYPHSRVPFVRGMLVQRDYYSIEWPVTTRQWTFGTYVHEVLAHNMPWISTVRCGIGGAGS